MAEKDMNQLQAEGDITDISTDTLNGHYFIRITITNHPYTDNSLKVNITMYAYDNFAKYLETQVSISDKVFAVGKFIPVAINSAYLPYFKIIKLFITRKYFGLNLQLTEEDIPI